MIMTCRGWDWGKCCRRVNIVSPGAAATAEKMVEALGKLWGSLISSSFLFFFLFFSNYWFKYTHIDRRAFDTLAKCWHDASLGYLAGWEWWWLPGYLISGRLAWRLTQLCKYFTHAVEVKVAWVDWRSHINRLNSMQWDICYLHNEWRRSTRQRSVRVDRQNSVQTIPLKIN